MEGERDMAQFRQRWALTDATYDDSQWMAWNAKTGQLESPPRQRGRPRLQLNVFKGWLDIPVARLLSTHPQIIVKPGSSDDKVVNAARVCTKVVGEYEWSRQSMEEVMAEFIPGFYRHGDGALKVEWNPKGGRYLGQKPKPLRGPDGNKIQAVREVEEPVLDEMGMPVLGDFGNPVIQMRPELAFGPDGIEPEWEPERDPITSEPVMLDEWEGCCETSYISSQDIFWDPAATNPRNAMWVLISVARSPAWIFDRYGVEVGAQPPSRSLDTFRWNRNLRSSNVAQTAQVDELWIKKGTYRFGPNPEDTITLPKGFVVVCAGDKLLELSENPYDHGEFPICFERALINDKQMRGTTPANSLREVQTAINKLASSIALNIDLTSDNQWLVPTDVDMPEADRRNGPGIHKRYTPSIANPNSKPEMVPGQSPAAGLFTFLEMLRAQFGADISGLHQGGLGGGVPVGVEAGVALEAIVERDTTALAQVALGIGRLLKRWAYLTAQNWKQFVPERKMISVMGEWNEPEVYDFSGTDVYDSFEFAVVPQSVMPQSKAAEFQKAVLLADKGIIDQRAFLKRTGEDKTESMTEAQKQAANARKENAEVQETGFITTPPEVIMAWDDALIHMEEHKRLLLDRVFMREKPDAYMQLQAHCQLYHIPIIEQMQAQAMAQQSAEASGPKAPGAAPPPPAAEAGQQPFTVPRPGISGPA